MTTQTPTPRSTVCIYPCGAIKSKFDKEEVQLSQGDWAYSAYAFEKVTDEAVNYGYDNWYSVPVKLIAANDGADKDGFLIQTGKAVTADGATTHTALEADTGLIKISFGKIKPSMTACQRWRMAGRLRSRGRIHTLPSMRRRM